MARDNQFRFDIFEVDPASCELRRSGVRIHLQEQPFRLLEMLLRRPGDVVTRDEIRTALWPGDEFGDFDHATNVAIKKIRDALGDDPDRPKYVETVTHRGYRFSARVLRDDNETTHPNRLKLWSVAAGSALLVAVGVIALIVARDRFDPIRPFPFTTLQGIVAEPVFSPDGNEIAFGWRTSESRPRIYVQSIGSIVARRLTDDNEPGHIERCPRWFPDGRAIAYIRNSPNKTAEIWMVPRSGGMPRKLFDVNWLQIFDMSPDGKSIVTAEQPPNESSSLFVRSMDGIPLHRLTQPQGNQPSAVAAGAMSGDRYPKFSPDGKHVVFIRIKSAEADLFRVSSSGGEPERLSQGLGYTVGFGPSFAFEHDGKSLIVIANRPGSSKSRSWWRLGLRDKSWKPLPMNDGDSLVVSKDGKRAAYIGRSLIGNVWRIYLPNSENKSPKPEDLTGSLSLNAAGSLSPDNRRIAFASNRTGHFEIYVSGLDGSNLVQLTNLQGGDAGSARWSPDGSELAFDYRPSGHAHIFTIDANGGPPRQLTSGDSDNVLPRYSRDGQSIYFARLRQGGSELWKMQRNGGGARMVAPDGLAAEESYDGSKVFYAKLSKKNFALFSRDSTGASEQFVLEEKDDTAGADNGFQVFSDGIYYRTRPSPFSLHKLVFYNFETKRSETLLEFPFLIRWVGSISPDRSSILVTKEDFQSHIMLIDEWR